MEYDMRYDSPQQVYPPPPPLHRIFPSVPRPSSSKTAHQSTLDFGTRPHPSPSSSTNHGNVKLVRPPRPAHPISKRSSGESGHDITSNRVNDVSPAAGSRSRFVYEDSRRDDKSRGMEMLRPPLSSSSNRDNPYAGARALESPSHHRPSHPQPDPYPSPPVHRHPSPPIDQPNKPDPAPIFAHRSDSSSSCQRDPQRSISPTKLDILVESFRAEDTNRRQGSREREGSSGRLSQRAPKRAMPASSSQFVRPPKEDVRSGSNERTSKPQTEAETFFASLNLEPKKSTDTAVNRAQTDSQNGPKNPTSAALEWRSPFTASTSADASSHPSQRNPSTPTETIRPEHRPSASSQEILPARLTSNKRPLQSTSSSSVEKLLGTSTSTSSTKRGSSTRPLSPSDSRVNIDACTFKYTISRHIIPSPIKRSPITFKTNRVSSTQSSASLSSAKHSEKSTKSGQSADDAISLVSTNSSQGFEILPTPVVIKRSTKRTRQPSTQKSDIDDRTVVSSKRKRGTSIIKDISNQIVDGIRLGGLQNRTGKVSNFGSKRATRGSAPTAKDEKRTERSTRSMSRTITPSESYLVEPDRHQPAIAAPIDRSHHPGTKGTEPKRPATPPRVTQSPALQTTPRTLRQTVLPKNLTPNRKPHHPTIDPDPEYTTSKRSTQASTSTATSISTATRTSSAKTDTSTTSISSTRSLRPKPPPGKYTLPAVDTPIHEWPSQAGTTGFNPIKSKRHSTSISKASVCSLSGVRDGFLGSLGAIERVASRLTPTGTPKSSIQASTPQSGASNYYTPRQSPSEVKAPSRIRESPMVRMAKMKFPIKVVEITREHSLNSLSGLSSALSSAPPSPIKEKRVEVVPEVEKSVEPPLQVEKVLGHDELDDFADFEFTAESPIASQTAGDNSNSPRTPSKPQPSILNSTLKSGSRINQLLADTPSKRKTPTPLTRSLSPRLSPHITRRQTPTLPSPIKPASGRKEKAVSDLSIDDGRLAIISANVEKELADVEAQRARENEEREKAIEKLLAEEEDDLLDFGMADVMLAAAEVQEDQGNQESLDSTSSTLTTRRSARLVEVSDRPRKPRTPSPKKRKPPTEFEIFMREQNKAQRGGEDRHLAKKTLEELAVADKRRESRSIVSGPMSRSPVKDEAGSYQVQDGEVDGTHEVEDGDDWDISMNEMGEMEIDEGFVDHFKRRKKKVTKSVQKEWDGFWGETPGSSPSPSPPVLVLDAGNDVFLCQLQEAVESDDPFELEFQTSIAMALRMDQEIGQSIAEWLFASSFRSRESSQWPLIALHNLLGLIRIAPDNPLPDFVGMAQGVMEALGCRYPFDRHTQGTIFDVGISRQDAAEVICVVITDLATRDRISSIDARAIVPVLLLLSVDATTSRTVQLSIDDCLTALWPIWRMNESAINIAKHVTEYLSPFPLSLKTRALLKIGLATSISREIVRWLAIGFLIPEVLDAEEPTPLPLVQDLMKAVLFIRKAQLQERDSVKASDALTCLFEGMNDLDGLVDAMEDGVESEEGNEAGSELDELRLEITKLHHKIADAAEGDPLPGITKSRLGVLGRTIKIRLESALNRRKRKVVLREGLKMGQGGQTVLDWVKKEDVKPVI